MKVMLPTEMTK